MWQLLESKMSAGVYVEEAKLMGLEDPMAIVDYVSKRQAEEREERARQREREKEEREERDRQREHELKMQQMKIEEEERNRRHQLEMVRVQTETNGGSPAQPSTLPHIRLPAFKEELYQFDEATKKLHFQSLFEGKPLEILHRLDASDKTYLSMKSALMRAYGLTVDEAKLQFNRAMMQDKETAAQFLVRLSGYLDQWLEKDGTPNTKEGLRDLVLRSQLEKSCPQDLVAQFKIHKTKTAEQMADKADAHFSAFGYHTRKQWKKPVSSLGQQQRRQDLPLQQQQQKLHPTLTHKNSPQSKHSNNAKRAAASMSEEDPSPQSPETSEVKHQTTCVHNF
nr:golgin subfamily A member 6-like protein 22 [Penaeus vannamei]